MRGARGLLFGLLLALVATLSLAATGWERPAGDLQAVPPLAARVTDLAGTLSTAQRAALEEKLQAAEGRFRNQIAVLIVPTTRPEAIEDYSIRVVEQWKLGQKGFDNGVLFLVARDDRRMRIEVGYGLEGLLPDVVAKRILDEVVAPRFRQGDFAGGIAAGIDRIEETLAKGEPQSAPGAQLPQPRGQSSPMAGLEAIGPLVIFALVLLPVIGGVLRAIFGRFAGSLLGGAGAGVVGWLITGSLIAGAFIALIGLFLIAMSGAGVGGLAHRGRTRGWTTGGWGGGGWSGGGGGGFSGGGGGFGGGGASSNW